MGNKIFLTIGMLILTGLVIFGSSLLGSVLINNFGSIGFLTAPFATLGLAYIMYLAWKRFIKYLSPPKV